MQSVAPAMAERGAFAAFIIDGLSGGRRLEGFGSVFVALLRELAKGFPVPAGRWLQPQGSHWIKWTRYCGRHLTSSTTR